MTPGVATSDVTQLLIAQLAAFLALLLAASAIHKVLDWRRTLGVVRDFAGVPRAAAGAAFAAVSVAELFAGALLVVPKYRMAGAWLATLILAAYLALILRALLANRRVVDCGCSFGPARGGLGAFEVGRNALLIAMALLVAVSGSVSEAPVMASQAFGACVFLALYVAIDQVMSVRPMRPGTAL